MRRLRTILVFAPIVACVALWVLSYPWFAFVHYRGADGRRWYLLSDIGGLYAATGSAGVLRGATGWDGAVVGNSDVSASMERGFGTTPQRWKPVRVIDGVDSGSVIVVLVMPWWFVTVLFAVPAIWYWRRRRSVETGRGFEVSAAAAASSPASSATASPTPSSARETPP